MPGMPRQFELSSRYSLNLSDTIDTGIECRYCRCPRIRHPASAGSRCSATTGRTDCTGIAQRNVCGDPSSAALLTTNVSLCAVLTEHASADNNAEIAHFIF